MSALQKDNEGDSANPSLKITRRQMVTVIIICLLNLINYIDRYTVAGILADIQDTFDMSNSQAGLLQTAFIFVFMFVAPFFGYLGDRYSRKWLIAGGILFWCGTSLGGSFMPNYGSFLAFRCLVGVGEASYSTNAPTIISDLFVGDKRSKMLAVYSFAIPAGAGIGFMLGAIILIGVGGDMTEEERIDKEIWRWSLRVTPWLGFIAVILIVMLLEEPERGRSEGGHNLRITSMKKDIKYLLANKAFVLDTLGFSCVAFVLGALAWWSPLFISLGVKVQADTGNVPGDIVPIIFGAVSMAAGLMGVPLGSYIGQKLRVKYPKADPLVCGFGLAIALPILLATIFLAEHNTLASLILCFIGQLFQNLSWAIVIDIMLCTVIPTRRSSASALMILVCHALGDAGSPYILGLIAEAFKPLIKVEHPFTTTSLPSVSTLYSTAAASPTTDSSYSDDDYIQFKALLYSMAVVTLLNAIAAIFFVWLSFYIVKAKEKVADAIKETQANEQKLSSVTYGNDSKPDGADEVDNCYPTDTKNSLEGNDNPSFINAEKNI